jgi:hypothetical protein
VGISPDEVRSEISALIRTNGGSHPSGGDSPAEKPRAAKAPVSKPKPKMK